MDCSKVVGLIKSNPIIYSIYLYVRDWKSYFQYLKAGTFSQHGEDSVLTQYFGQDFKGYYVDIGCSHPFRISNTFLLYKNGWNGVVVDPIPAFKGLYKRWRPRDSFVNAGVGPNPGRLTYFELTPSVLSSFSEDYVNTLVKEKRATVYKTYEVEVLSPEQLFDSHVSADKIDLLSIDVENLDFDIVNSINFQRWSPRVICVEFNNDLDKDKIVKVLTDNGYLCDKEIGCNIIAIYKRGKSNCSTVNRV